MDNAPIFLAVTGVQHHTRKLRTALEGTAIAAAIMLFFALCGAWIFSYLNITKAAFKIILLFFVELDTSAKSVRALKAPAAIATLPVKQQRRRRMGIISP